VQRKTATKRPQRLRWGVGITLIVCGLAGLAFWAVSSPGALAYYKTPTEVSSQEIRPDQNVRVGGRVRELERSPGRAEFVLTDGRHIVPVSYRGEVPDTLKDGTDGVAEGTIGSDGTLVAKHVQAKCSSKFMTKKDRTNKTVGS
jgi:cytochrome c-type biogenesis protein CcmE